VLFCWLLGCVVAGSHLGGEGAGGASDGEGEGWGWGFDGGCGAGCAGGECRKGVVEGLSLGGVKGGGGWW
jgi:hypothetical protein